jgi:hypothetical protein
LLLYFPDGGGRGTKLSERAMNKKISLHHSLDLLAALATGAAVLGVVQTFIIGKHFIIPTMILFFAVLFGNLARYGFQDRAWAKQILFWVFFLLTAHVFFALFFAVKYRVIFGAAFEFVFGGMFVALAFLVSNYARKNGILR